MIERLIIADYQERVALSPDIPADLRRALRTHERVPAFMSRLLAQIKQCEKKGLHLSRELIKQMTYDFTDMFIKAVKTKAEQDAKPYLFQPKPQLHEQLDAQGNGTIEELGITIRDRSPANGTNHNE